MDDVIRQADQIWSRAKSSCDNPGNSEAQHLIEQALNLHEEAQNGKPRDYLIDKTDRLRHAIEAMQSRADLFSPEDLDDLRDRCEDLKQKLHSL